MVNLACKDFFTNHFPVKVDDVEIKNG
jgi:nicotinate-nucleotide adenylyltransferase